MCESRSDLYIHSQGHKPICTACGSSARSVRDISRVGQNRIYAPYMTVYEVVSLPKIPYIHRVYMVLANSRQRRHEK